MYLLFIEEIAKLLVDNKIPKLPSTSALSRLSFKSRKTLKKIGLLAGPPPGFAKKDVFGQIIKKDLRPKGPLPSILRKSPMTPPSQRQPRVIKKVKKQLKKPAKKVLRKPAKKVSRKPSNNCMKMRVKSIKSSKQYKALPRSAGKSKLKKAQLCALLQKKTGKPLKDYSKMTKTQLLDIINKKKNCN